MQKRQLASVALLVLVAGCGLDMEKHYGNIRSSLVGQRFDEADRYLDKEKEPFYGEKNRLLYYMDKSMVLYLGRRYEESNRYLEQAKRAAEELWTESIGANAAAWLTTDNTLPYQGEDFEKVLLHFVAALNYIGLGRYEAARVEARQVTSKLELYNSKYGEAKNVYRDDAFARWLAGKLAETEGGQSGLNDAWIDYRKALEIYESDYAKRYRTPTPQYLIADALRVTSGLGEDFRSEFEQLRAKYPSAQFLGQGEHEKMGEIIFFHLNGEAPYKIDRFWTAQAGPEVIRIAFPEFVAKPHRIRAARVEADGPARVAKTTELGEDITAIAIQNLNDHMGRIKAKTIARQVSKYLAAKGLEAGGAAVSKKGSQTAQGVGAAMQVAGALWTIGSAVAEEADKRSWITLPSQVGVSQLYVPPGPVKLHVTFLGPGGQALDAADLTAQAQAGKTTFVTWRSYQ